MADTITTINGFTLDSYHADLVSYEVSQYDVSDNVIAVPFSVKPIPLKARVGPKRITLDLDFMDTSSNYRAAQNLSDFLNILMSFNDYGQYIELYLRDGFYYTCCFEKASDPVTKAPWIEQCSVTFVGFRHREKLTQSKTASTQGTIMYPHCDRESPIKIKVTPVNMPSSLTLTVAGQTIHFSGVSGYVEIDTLYATVRDANGNAFAKCDISEFPTYQGYTSVGWSTNTSSNVQMEILPVVM